MRYINTRFWDDAYIQDLIPIHKLIFLYLITNALTELCGAYEITTKRISADVGVKEQAVTDCLRLLEADGKVCFRANWVFIKNFQKHQAENPSVKLGIERSWEGLPEKIRSQFEEWTGSIQAVTGSPQAGTLNRDLIETRLNRDLIESETDKPTPALIAKNLFSQEDAQAKLIADLAATGFPEQLARTELKKFIAYWTEPNPTGTKQKWQLEKTFEVGRRLKKWFSGMKSQPSYKSNRVTEIL